jgi:hypothetical protein
MEYRKTTRSTATNAFRNTATSHPGVQNQPATRRVASFPFARRHGLNLLTEKERTFPMRHSSLHLATTPLATTSLATIALALLVALTSAANVACADEDIAALTAAAREKFQPITAEQVAAAKASLAGRAAALERYVRPNTTNGKKWLAYLDWEAFQTALGAEGQTEFAPLVATYNKLNKDQTGLELKPFRSLADALRNYIDLAAMSRQEKQADVFAAQLDGLTKELEQYGSTPSAATSAAIGRRLDLLTGLGQSPELVDAVRAQFSHPNAFFTASTDLLHDAAAKPINRNDPITDVILGTRIRGRGHTTGTVDLVTVPSQDKAIIKITTDGRVVSQNMGYNGPAVIRSTGYTDFDATQFVEFTPSRFYALPAQVSASTRSNIHSVSKAGGGAGRRIVANVGMKKAHEKQGQANRIAGQHAEVRIADRMTAEIDKRLKKAWNRYRNEYRLPLERRGENPISRFSTTDSALAFETTQANRGQLAAPAAPPEATAGADLVLRLHESAINNYTAAMLAGATLSESKPGEGTKADVKLPPFLKDAWKNRMDEKAEAAADAEFEAWSLKFRNDRPITVAFVDGKVQLTLHIANLKSGDDVFDRWDVTAIYTPELVDGGVKLTRDGELNVLPTGFDAEKGQLSAKQVALRRNLTKVLTERSDKGRGIPQTIKVDQLEPSDELANVGPLPVQAFDSKDGWLTVAWDRK